MPRCRFSGAPSSSATISPIVSVTRARRMFGITSNSLAIRNSTGSLINCSGYFSITLRFAMGPPHPITRSPPAGDGRDDRDLRAILDGGLFVIQKADILIIHVDVDKAAQLAAVVIDPSLQTGIF